MIYLVANNQMVQLVSVQSSMKWKLALLLGVVASFTPFIIVGKIALLSLVVSFGIYAILLGFHYYSFQDRYFEDGRNSLLNHAILLILPALVLDSIHSNTALLAANSVLFLQGFVLLSISHQIKNEKTSILFQERDGEFFIEYDVCLPTLGISPSKQQLKLKRSYPPEAHLEFLLVSKRRDGLKRTVQFLSGLPNEENFDLTLYLVVSNENRGRQMSAVVLKSDESPKEIGEFLSKIGQLKAYEIVCPSTHAEVSFKFHQIIVKEEMI